MRGRDLAFGIVSLALSAGYYWLASRIPESRLADAVGPQGLPKTYAIALAVLSIGLIARSLAAGRHISTVERAAPPRVGRAAGTLGIGALYILVVPWLGYFLSVTGLIFATACHYREAASRRVVVVALCGAAFCWLLFVRLMRIPQPPGFWTIF